jgi:CheY-like chemotaxis protein
MLEDLGHEVIEASSGAQAIRVLRQGKRIDLVITDHLMPGMTGTQLAEAIRSEWPHVLLILATGYAELSPDTAPDLLRLSKPFRQDDLSRAIIATIEAAEQAHRVVPFRPKQG